MFGEAEQEAVLTNMIFFCRQSPPATKKDLLDTERRLMQFILAAVSSDHETISKLTNQINQSDDALQDAVNKQMKGK